MSLDRPQRTLRWVGGSASGGRRGRGAATHPPRQAAGNRSVPWLTVRTADDAYEQFRAAVQAELAPAGVLEELLAASVIEAAWALKRAQRPGRRDAEQRLALSLAALGRLRGCCPPRAVRPDQDQVGTLAPAQHRLAAPVDERGSCSTPLASLPGQSGEPSESLAAGRDRGGEQAVCWSQRLGFEPEVAVHSPVIRGTWVTASQVVGLILEGWSWTDILRTHPELTEEDIRACLAYSVEAEDLGLNS